jgi:hypothetical protein
VLQRRHMSEPSAPRTRSYFGIVEDTLVLSDPWSKTFSPGVTRGPDGTGPICYQSRVSFLLKNFRALLAPRYQRDARRVEIAENLALRLGDDARGPGGARSPG